MVIRLGEAQRVPIDKATHATTILSGLPPSLETYVVEKDKKNADLKINDIKEEL